MTTVETLAEIRKELNEQFFEREEVIEGSLLALVGRQHCFILGPPGTAKSLLCREITGRITGSTYFEVLLSKNRPDQAVLGPYDLPLLRDKGEFKRKDNGYLTTVDFAFLDELGKSSPTLGHDLLAALNERIKHVVNGQRSAVDIPLHTVFAASNEHPAAEGEDGAALWDRLLVRTTVEEIREDIHFKDLMERVSAPGAKRSTITLDDLQQAVVDADSVILLDPVLDAVLEIRRRLRQQGINISDRRWRESMSVIRASAYLAGRDIADVEDVTALRFTLWDDLEQKKKVERLILAVASPATEEATALLDSAQEELAALRSHRGEATETLAQVCMGAYGKANNLERQALKLRKGTSVPGALATLDEAQRVVDTIKGESQQMIGFIGKDDA